MQQLLLSMARSACAEMLLCLMIPLLGLMGCALQRADSETLRAEALKAAADAKLVWTTHQGHGFEFVTAARIAPDARRVHVYVEGDGNAFVTRSRVSRDPTPRNPVALRLAEKDPHPSVVYVGRPCQYLTRARLATCAQKFWTTARYAQLIVTAIDKALGNVLQVPRPANPTPPKLGLIGFSGGGTLAALLAAQRTDVDWLVTIAANLDHARWTRHHNLTPLRGSVSLLEHIDTLARVRQLHLLGGTDAIVPPALASTFVAELRSRSVPGTVTLRVLPDFDHGCCWADIWPDALEPLSH